jgi:hypothetical protein
LRFVSGIPGISPKKFPRSVKHCASNGERVNRSGVVDVLEKWKTGLAAVFIASVSDRMRLLGGKLREHSEKTDTPRAEWQIKNSSCARLTGLMVRRGVLPSLTRWATVFRPRCGLLSDHRLPQPVGKENGQSNLPNRKILVT